MKNYKKYIFTGIMSLIPMMITFWIIQYLFIIFSVPGKVIVSKIFDIAFFNNELFLKLRYTLEYVLGFVLTILFLYFVGIIISNVLGKRLYKFFEKILQRIPLVSKIYTTVKNVTETITKQDSKAFEKVVLIQYPREDLWTLAMVTGESKDLRSIEYYNLFVPTTPNPTSGYLIMIKKSDAIETDLSVDDGLSIIISGGMVSPKILNIK